MHQLILGLSIIAGTVAVYILMQKLYQRFPIPFLLPVLTTSLLIILFLLAMHIPYRTYMVGGEWINRLLGPAIVALAYPLYQQRKSLKQYSVAIMSGVFIGAVTAILSGFCMASLGPFSAQLVHSLLPKSITTPVAMQIAAETGGIPSLTALFVMIAGFTGAILGPYLLRWFHIDDQLSQGIALGSASHVIGISKAQEYGEQAVSMSSVAMTLSALLGSLLIPLWLSFFS